MIGWSKMNREQYAIIGAYIGAIALLYFMLYFFSNG